MTNGAQQRQTKSMAKRAAENLSAELARQGFSDREAANRLGLTNVYVSRRASGSVEMSVSDLELFADFLSVPVLRLLEDRDVPVRVVKLPDLDSNQEPIGSQSAPVISLSNHTPKKKKSRLPKARPLNRAEVLPIRRAQ